MKKKFKWDHFASNNPEKETPMFLSYSCIFTIYYKTDILTKVIYQHLNMINHNFIRILLHGQVVVTHL